MSAAESGVYRVLIVDDNPYVGESLKSSLPWRELGLEVCAVTRNAQQARNALESHHPDILLTDIRMPGSSGLELATDAKSVLPNLQVIVFTGYDEFSYAQEALRLGAVDVILKPLQNIDVERALGRAVANLAQISRGSEAGSADAVRLSTTLRDARRKFLNDLIFGYVPDEEDAQRIARAVRCSLRRYQLLVGVRNDPRLSGSEDHGLISAWLHATTRDNDGTSIAVIIDGMPVFVVDVEPFAGEYERSGIVREVALQMQRIGNDPDLRVAVSAPHSHLLRMKTAYAEARTAIAKFFVDPGARFSAFEPDNVPESGLDSAVQSTLERLREMVSSGISADDLQSPRIDEQVRILFDLVSIQHRFGLPNMQRLLDQIFDRLGIHPLRAGGDIWRDAPGLPWRSLDEARDELLGLIRNRSEPASDSHIPDWHTRRMLNYLQNNYALDVSLAAVAADLNLSPSYVSRLTKRTTGQTFTELLSGVRVEKAKLLLRQTDAKVYQVAEMVGIRNYAYFFQVFRKVTGISPNDYRSGVEPPRGSEPRDNIPNKRATN